MIDDAVQAVECGKSDRQALGAELDEVKTLQSSIKFIFLNRFFCEGAEVYTPAKVYAKADSTGEGMLQYTYR